MEGALPSHGGKGGGGLGVPFWAIYNHSFIVDVKKTRMARPWCNVIRLSLLFSSLILPQKDGKRDGEYAPEIGFF